MVVGDLRQMIEGVDDEMQVLIPLTQEFDGVFYSPCIMESGVTEMGGDEDVSPDDVEELALVDKLEMRKEFCLVPCGFSEERDHSHELN